MKKINKVHAMMTIFGIVLIAVGSSICNYGQVGVDPFTAMNIALSSKLGISFGLYQMLLNLVLFLGVLKISKHYIGFGTIVNMIGIGFLIELFTSLWRSMFTITITLPLQVAMLIVGVLILTLGASLYMRADLGVAPYDAIALIANEKYHKNFAVSRIICDMFCAGIGFFLNGPVGAGTIVFAFFTGPFIRFYDTHVSNPLLAYFDMQNAKKSTM